MNTAEKFLILIQHPTKSRFIISGQVKNAGLVGSILLDLANEKNIAIENNRLIAHSTKTNLSRTHQLILQQIRQSPKVRKTKSWVARLTRKSKQYQKYILIELARQGIIGIENRSFMGFNYYRTNLVNTKIRNDLISEMRSIIFDNKQLDNSNSSILGLIDACKAHKLICNSTNELKICKKKLKEIMHSDSISQGVDKVIKEMQAAIITAILIPTVVASSN